VRFRSSREDTALSVAVVATRRDARARWRACGALSRELMSISSQSYAFKNLEMRSIGTGNTTVELF
jgi:hypothetical protein